MKLLECSLELPPTPGFLLMEAVEINEWANKSMQPTPSGVADFQC